MANLFVGQMFMWSATIGESHCGVMLTDRNC